VWFRDSIATNDLTDQKHVLNKIEQQTLAELKASPANSDYLIGKFSGLLDDTASVLNSLVKRGLLVSAEEDESRKFAVNRVDIETSSHCNARCVYCPVSIDPKPKRIMGMELFTQIVRQIALYRPE